jgi:hypothetical protein
MKYILMKLEDKELINFEEVEETSVDTLLGTEDDFTTVKWCGNTPSFIGDLSYYEGPFNASEIRSILDNKILIV